MFKNIGEFRKLVDVNFIMAMGPPGGGRNPVTMRLSRHCNMLTFPDMEDPSKRKIFGTIFNFWLSANLSLHEFGSRLVDTCISVYNTVTTQVYMIHYIFHIAVTNRHLGRWVGTFIIKKVV